MMVFLPLFVAFSVCTCTNVCASSYDTIMIGKVRISHCTKYINYHRFLFHFRRLLIWQGIGSEGETKWEWAWKSKRRSVFHMQLHCCLHRWANMNPPKKCFFLWKFIEIIMHNNNIFDWTSHLFLLLRSA